MANKNLNAAKTAKKDEFYTQLTDIERELQHYWPHFRDKVVLCNCDDPYESNFFKYFALRFNQLGLKKLICTCYNGSPVQGNELLLRFEPWDDDDEIKKKAYKVEITEVKDLNGDGAVDLSDVRYLLQNDKNVLSTLQTGDFRDPECIELLKQADIVVTNPPFSLFREYIAQLMKYDKKFVIMGRMSALHYSEIFPLFMENRMWCGFGFNLLGSTQSVPLASESIPSGKETAAVEDDFDFKEVFFSVLSALSAFVSFTVFLVSTGADPIKASSPRPNPFLATSNHLLRKFFITFCTGTFWVVFTDRKSMRRCF